MEKGSRIKAKPDIPWSGYAERENNSSDPHTGNGNNPDLHGPHGDQEQREDEQSLDSPVATAPFPLHCFPPVLQSMARAISESTLVPDNLSGACVLGILSAALGKGIHVQSSPNRLTRGNLYIAPSALSGTGKSEAFRHAAAPFQSIEEEESRRGPALNIRPCWQASRYWISKLSTCKNRYRKTRKRTTRPSSPT